MATDIKREVIDRNIREEIAAEFLALKL